MRNSDVTRPFLSVHPHTGHKKEPGDYLNSYCVISKEYLKFYLACSLRFSI